MNRTKTTMNWRKTGYAPELLGAWLCVTGEYDLIVLQHTSVGFSAAVRDTNGNVLVSLDRRFQTWVQATLWAEAQLGVLRAKQIQSENPTNPCSKEEKEENDDAA